MATERITDPVLGEDAVFFGGGDRAWISFEREFAPVDARVLVLTARRDGGVPQQQRNLYREIEAWYPKGVEEVHKAIRREIESNDGLRKWLPPDFVPNQQQLQALRNWMPPEQIPNRLRLLRIDLRHPFPLPAKWVLTYQFDPNQPVWYVRIGEDLTVEWCGLGD
jgi:hypothetical protein